MTQIARPENKHPKTRLTVKREKENWIKRSTKGAGNATVLNQKRGSTESVRQRGEEDLTRGTLFYHN